MANNYGNLCQRIFSFIKANCSNVVKKNKQQSDEDKKLVDLTNIEIKNLREDINNLNLNTYIKKTVNISFMTNKYINDEQPWKVKKTDIQKMNNILHLSLEQIAKISLLLNPIIPQATTKVLKALNLNIKSLELSFLDGKEILNKEAKINDLEILFKKII